MVVSGSGYWAKSVHRLKGIEIQVIISRMVAFSMEWIASKSYPRCLATTSITIISGRLCKNLVARTH
jgi:hypothetical protein